MSIAMGIASKIISACALLTLAVLIYPATGSLFHRVHAEGEPPEQPPGGQFSQRELALLCTLIYCDEVVNPEYENEKLAVPVNELLLKTDMELGALNLYGDFRNMKRYRAKSEAGAALRSVLEDIQCLPDLMNMKIAKQCANDATPSGITAMCLTGSSGNDSSAVAVFRGSGGAFWAWGDNCEGAGTTIATPMQMTAKAFVDDLEFDALTVTGHSKGGNLAAFVAIMCPNVTECVSFNGYGFSEEFHNRNKELIDANAEKITVIASDKDIVSGLLTGIKQPLYIQTNTSNFAGTHYITALLDESVNFGSDGNYASFAEQSPLAKSIETFTDAVILALPPFWEEQLTDICGTLAVYTSFVKQVLFAERRVTFDTFLSEMACIWNDSPMTHKG